MATSAPDRATMAGFFAMVVLIGTNFVAVRLSNQELSPFWGATLRYVIATLLLCLFVFVRRIPFPRGAALKASLWYGVLNFAGFFGLMYWGLVEVGAGAASVVLSAVPLLTYLLALTVRLERFAWAALFGAMIVIVGIGLIGSGGGDAVGHPIRFAAIVLAAFMAAGASIVVKRAPRMHPLAMNAAGMGIGAGLLAVFTVLANDPVVWPQRSLTLWIVAYLVLASIVLFGLMVWIIGRWTATGATYAGVLAPIVTVIVAHLVLDETITLRFLAGGALVLFGVYWGALKKRPLDDAKVVPIAEVAPPAHR